MAIKKFEDVIVWQKAQEFAVAIYSEFTNCKDYGFRDQITRAVVSISNNIAEGFERGTNADFKRFLYFAVSSNSEVRSMLYLAEKLSYLGIPQSLILIEKSNEISKMLYGLIKSITKP
ncbi:four helix bundle protein [Ulvibacter sp. MAR_2010_11]|uniref:four helix bundle protein n=1 Tax=Ulvibacter sp. MAR_2010_11 TaxID=1250229 RepID=UPI000C2B65B8|nr:four helix bundle protein [Ulvibacter sp. MAR_2010_11]PKA82648.1 four helix bundle protein [Ulvibacter sp. MAR_2010_11]